jgi:RNA 3'-terminal phosphate cyclase (ATP)
LEGAKVGSREIMFWPGEKISGGNFNFDIGTAGSTTMLASILLPISLFAERDSTYRLTGGLFQDFAPSTYHLKGSDSNKN